MGLVVVGIFDDVYEGEIAASLLRSAGIETFLLGEQLAKYDGFSQRAWGGVRLNVNADCHEDAIAILEMAKRGELADAAPSDIAPPSHSPLWWLSAGLLMLTGGAEAGWAISGLRRRQTALMWTGAFLAALLLVFFIANAVRMFGAALRT